MVDSYVVLPMRRQCEMRCTKSNVENRYEGGRVEGQTLLSYNQSGDIFTTTHPIAGENV